MAYMNAIQSVQLYGPTNFAPVIRHVTKFAHDEAQKQAASVCVFSWVELSHDNKVNLKS